MSTTTPRRRPLALAAATVLALSACASEADGSEDSTASADEMIRVEKAWTKASDEKMTAAFGELTNTTDEDITVVAVETDAAPRTELHETVEDESGQMTMQEKEGGFTIPADETLALEPGGDHIMLMELPTPIASGDEVTFTLVLDDDTEQEFTAPAKDYSGANETYGDEEGGEMSHDDHGGDDHGDDDHGGDDHGEDEHS